MLTKATTITLKVYDDKAALALSRKGLSNRLDEFPAYLETLSLEERDMLRAVFVEALQNDGTALGGLPLLGALVALEAAGLSGTYARRS